MTDKPFDYKGIDFAARPEAYRMGRGEQGVLTAEPYKSQLLPLWKFKTPDVAKTSAAALYKKFCAFKRQGDFVGMDMARKFVQMGVTRSRRYANHASGRKYDADGKTLRLDPDPVKAQCAEIFATYLKRIRADETYQAAVATHKAQQVKRRANKATAGS